MVVLDELVYRGEDGVVLEVRADLRRVPCITTITTITNIAALALVTCYQAARVQRACQRVLSPAGALRYRHYTRVRVGALF